MSNIIKATKRPEGLILLVDSAAGIYVPQKFVENFDIGQWVKPTSDMEDAYNILLRGPDEDFYDDAWVEILDEAESTLEWEGEQYKYQLYQDGDLWAYCGELMSNDEWESFGFDPLDKPIPRGYTAYAACSDCLMWIANGDDSGMSEATAEHVKEMCSRLPGNAVADGLDLGFHHDECDICNALPGNRYRVLVEDKQPEFMEVHKSE